MMSMRYRTPYSIMPATRRDGPPVFLARSPLCSLAVIGFLSFCLGGDPATARTWHVPGDAPTIQAGVDSASAGDDVLVAPGHYYEHDIVLKEGLLIHSELGADVTTVDAGGAGIVFTCSDLSRETVLEGFGITNGQDEYGGGIRSINARLTIHVCIITGCTSAVYGGGIYADGGEICVVSCTVSNCSAYVGGAIGTYDVVTLVQDCSIIRNEASYAGGVYGGGMQVTIEGCSISDNMAFFGWGGGIMAESTTLTIRDCEVTDNHVGLPGLGDGIAILNCSGLVSGCTVARNTGAPGERCGIHLSGTSDLVIERTVVAFNLGPAFCCDGAAGISCCDIYGNTHGNDLCGTDLGGNFSLDPLFCDPENGDYTLDGCSPCLPGNHPDGVDCGLIGALGQGCGATPVEESSWGRIKSLYHR
jgi:hypothetical protein